MAGPEPRAALALFDEHAAGVHRYLARRAQEAVAAELLLATLTSPEAVDDRSRLYGIATGLLSGREEAPDPTDPLAVGLAALPAVQRDAVLLAAWGRLDRDEIALALGLPGDAVREQLGRARAALRAGGLGDAELDGALAALRSDRPSDAPTLGALRERLRRGGAPVQQRTDGPPRPGPSHPHPRPGWRRHRGTAAAALALLLGALFATGAQEEPVPPRAAATAPPAPGQVLAYSEWTLTADTGSVGPSWTRGVPTGARLPIATGPVADLDLSPSDPVVGPGQYLYRRIERDGRVVELWIPPGAGEEWVLRDSRSHLPEQRAVDGAFAHPPPSGSLAVADLSPDPSRNHTLLRVATGIVPDPPAVALTIVADTLAHQPVPAELRSALLGALGFVPGLRVTTEDAGRTVAISADRRAGGRVDVLLDADTGLMIGDRRPEGPAARGSRVTTGVVDEIGERPAGS